MSPLRKGSSKADISANISELWHANDRKKKKRSKSQVIAIALSVAKRHKK